MRPPSPNARFFIPTWVAVDDLTPEERNKYSPMQEEDVPQSENTEVAQDVEEEEEAKESSDTIMATLDAEEETSQPRGDTITFAQGEPESSKEIDASTDPLSRLPSPGMPPVMAHSEKTSSSDLRPHDPVAAIIADTGAVPPSRPVSEPSTILITGPAAPLISDLVASPVAVTASPSVAPGPPPMDLADAAFVHSGSFETPFHALNAPVATKMESKTEQAPSEAMMVRTSESADDRVLEPETKRPRIE